MAVGIFISAALTDPQMLPIGRFAGPSQPVKRPKEFACFSYDDKHNFRPDDSSLKWYYPPMLGANLSLGFDTFIKHNEEQDGHLQGLLKAIVAHEQQTGTKIDAHIVTWRGMMTKIMSTPFDHRDAFEMNATLYQDCIFIEENHEYKLRLERSNKQRPRRGGPPPEVMQYWGYKFETLSTMPAPWGETSRDFIENRDKHVVNNEEQYCSVVRTGIGKATLCLGGEVDAIWDSKPTKAGDPINWVELKTSAQIQGPRDVEIFHQKLMKYWIQSFLLGVPKIIVGFRSRDGILMNLDEIQTQRIPDIIRNQPNASWNADMCVNFAAAFLEWLMKTIDDEGVWRIQRRPNSPSIEVFRIEQTGHGDILTDEFKNWRIKLALGPSPEADGPE